MDPNATLAEIRRLVAQHDRKALDEHDVDRLTDLIASLDQWLCKGGFVPDDWSPGP